MSSSVLVMIDWENVSKEIVRSKFNPEKFGGKTAALDNLFAWIKTEVNYIFDTFVFTPIHIMYTDYKILHDRGIVPTTCPKIPLGSLSQKDTVDPILIEKGLKWITHPDLTHICLVSGDADFVPLLKVAKQRELLIMISALNPAFARDRARPPLSKELAEWADTSPKTGKTMLHYFSPMIEN